VCYERGAEDNLTAVVVCVGQPLSAKERVDDLRENDFTGDDAGSPPVSAPEAQTILATGFDAAPGLESAFPRAYSRHCRRVATRANAIPSESPRAIENRLDLDRPRPKSGVERTMTRFFMFVLFLAVIGAAFYAGRKYKGAIPYIDGAVPVAEASPTPAVGDDPILKFERSRREVDNDPTRGWPHNCRANLHASR